MTPGQERIATVHKLLSDAGYDAVYGVTVPNKRSRIEGYNGPDRNLIVEYRWDKDAENVTIGIFHETGVPLEFDKLAEWLKN